MSSEVNSGQPQSLNTPQQFLNKAQHAEGGFRGNHVATLAITTQEFSMSQRSIRCSAIIAAALLSVAAAARADCEADMAQLDQVLKNPSLSAAGRTGLLEAKKKAIAAVKTDDDAACNKVIVGAI